MTTTNRHHAENMKSRVLILVSPFTRVNGIGVIAHEGGFALKVGLDIPARPGFPTQVEGVPIVYTVRDGLRPFSAEEPKSGLDPEAAPY